MKIENSLLDKNFDDLREKVVVAVVKTPDSQDISDKVKAICKEHLHDWKYPKEILFIDKLSRNTMGKILKEGL
ncbi:MAG: hypothetical protein K8R67_04620 [Desulfobacteraceae bacterium]|nr:hypothetical protein [Desulfobacteraceae bacterium]